MSMSEREISKCYGKDFRDIVESKNFQEIKRTVNYLNSQLESMFIYRSKKTRENKILEVNKRWLKLVFAVVETSVSRREPLPLVIELEMVNAVCSKCGFRWETSLEVWLQSNCPKCGSWETGMESETKE